MTTPHATSLSLPYDMVLGIIGDYINANLLKVPHVVRDIDCCDRQVINVGLELAAPADPPASTHPDPVDLTWMLETPLSVSAEPISPANGNGNHRGESQEGTAVPPTDGHKRGGGRGRPISAEQRAEVLRRRAAGERMPDIAAVTGISEGSCYEIVAAHRRFERSLQAGSDTSGSADVG